MHVSTGAISNLRFPGQWYSAESGLYQNWHRDYDPTTGRYMQADPLGLVDGASVYGYVLQSPGRYIDPMGTRSGEPSIWDQISIWGNDGTRDYADYFDRRFPNSSSGARNLLDDRVRRMVCNSRPGLGTLPGMTGGNNDVDITDTNMGRFGDQAQNWWERNAKIGRFQYKTNSVNVTPIGCGCYEYRSNVEVHENTGMGKYPPIRERNLIMATWPITGRVCCDGPFK